MPLPVLSTDFWSKPEPQGSINSTVMRLMATGGAALRQQTEAAAQKAEAMIAAPALAGIYKDSFARLAAGDMSGMQGMASATAMSASNPLLAAMARESNDIGQKLTSQVIEQKMQRERIDAQLRGNTAKIASEEKIAGMRIDEQQEGFNQRSDSAALKTYQKEFSDWQGEMARKQEESKISGTPFTPTAPPAKPQLRSKSAATLGVSQAPAGADESNPDFTSTDGLPTPTNPTGESPAGTGTPDSEAALPTDGAASPAQPQTTQPTARQPTGKPPTLVDENSDSFQIGTAKVRIGKANPAQQKELSLKDTHTGITKTYKLEDQRADREELAKQLGTISSNPEVAQAIGDHLGPGKGGVEFEEIPGSKDKFQVYVVANNGQRSPLTRPRRADDGTLVNETVTAGKDIQQAWTKINSLKGVVAPAFGLQIENDGQTKSDSPQLDKVASQMHQFATQNNLKAEDLKPVLRSLVDEVDNKTKELNSGKLDATEYNRQVNELVGKAKETLTDKKGLDALQKDPVYGYDPKEAATDDKQKADDEKRNQNKPAIERFRAQLDEVKTALKTNKSPIDKSAAMLGGGDGFGGITSFGDTPSHTLTHKERRDYSIRMFNIIKKLRALDPDFKD